jgi:hypothetical protein
MRIFAPLLLGALLAALFARTTQAQTFVVDVNNGPGTDFTSLATAANTAPDGAVLLVRAGSYPGMAISGKSLKVLAEPGVVLFGTTAFASAIAVSGTPAGKSVVLQGLTVTSGFPGWAGRISLSNNQGSVLLDRSRVASGVQGLLTVQQCDAVLVRGLDNATSSVRAEVTQSQLVCENSRIAVSQGTAMSITGGSVQLRDCTVAAGVFVAPANAIAMTGGEVRILGNSTLQAGIAGTPQVCVAGTGTVRHEPSVAFVNGVPFGPGITSTVATMPRMRASLSGGQVAVELQGEPGTIGAIALALVGTPLLVPGIQDALWLDPASTTVVTFGVFAAGAPITTSLPWAGGPVPAVRAVWQGVALDASGGLALSNPSLTILP